MTITPVCGILIVIRKAVKAMAEKLHFRKGDWIAVALVVALAVIVLLCFLPRNQSAAYAQVYLNGELIKTLPLDQDQTFTVRDTYYNEITVKDGAVCVTAADCPGEDCVHSGSIRTDGRVIVCLPNGLEIRVVSDVSDVDFVVG